MRMIMVHIRRVHVDMTNRGVDVEVVVFAGNGRLVAVRVMAVIMTVPVFMFQRQMGMAVGVIFKNDQPGSRQHDNQGDPKRKGKAFPEQHKRQHHADKRRVSVTGACPGRAKFTLRPYVKIDAQSV